MSRERVQKILARAGVASRRQVEDMIREGRVTINGDVAELGARVDLEKDAVKVDDKRVAPPRQTSLYFLVNKPRGVVSSRRDPEGRPTVLDLVPKRHHKGLVPVGRLDFDTEGLLILTDDGDFAHRVAHPRHGCIKTYEVKVKGEPSETALDRLRGGMVIDGRRTSPATVEPVHGAQGPRESTHNTWWRIGLTEGRNRQIREMFHRIGHPVQRLRRVAIGPITDPKLPRGEWRELTPDEVERLRTEGGKAPRIGRRRPRKAAGRSRGGSPAKGRPSAKGRGGRPPGGEGSRGKGSRGQGSRGKGGRGGRQ